MQPILLTLSGIIVAIILLSLCFAVIFYFKSLNCRNEYKPRERSFHNSLINRNHDDVFGFDVETAREAKECQFSPLQHPKVELLQQIDEEVPANKHVDSSLMESLDIINSGNLPTRRGRFHSDNELYITSLLMNFNFSNDFKNHLSSTKKSNMGSSYRCEKKKLRKCNTSGGGDSVINTSYNKEFEADVHARLCSTRRSSTSMYDIK
uniref:Uncharacterized protein n=1 Tax=Parastrongyloides trichosuri TaxID=131310 RepID=A0A0N4ZIG4_PARTI